ncbi:U32 family peptidase [uncultured Ilyobacter sp.]|uniref:peptidase U32 family protein n=1 Tax=uncultured Ilyobacter sp. TaxID=544433 RepID=UPI0029C7EEEB|nr:U32 family peptidase [uncultured Ilyobacter sp.]
MNIVAPAGNMERFYAAVKAGADEIYMGIKGFGARRNAENFTLSEYMEAIDYAHERGVKIFLTLNTVMRDREIEALYENLKALYERGLDAVIVQDLGLFRFIKTNFPDIDVHGSTQMTVSNHVEADYLKNIGFSRVVLSRELSLEEIRSVKENTEIELEVFVSGALCISYSGNCYLSSFIGGRSGNRGLCAQPCRKKYETSQGSRGYFLSPKDQLMGQKEIKKLKEIGVESIKLEGRMKSPHYVFETVGYYRGLVDGIDRNERTSDLFNRGYSKGHFYGDREGIINSKYPSDFGKFIGRIEGREIRINEDLTLGDGVSYVSKEYEKLGGEYVSRIRVKGEAENQKSARAGSTVVLEKIPQGVKYVYKNYSKYLNDEISRGIKHSKKNIMISGIFSGKVGERAILKLMCKNNRGKNISVVKYSDQVLEKATKRSMTPEEIESRIGEMGETTFCIEGLKVEFDGEAFMPLSLIKTLRREASESLREKLVSSYRRGASENIKKINYNRFSKKDIYFSVIVSNPHQREAALKFGIKKIYEKGLDVAKESQLRAIDLESRLASNLYQLLENKNRAVSVNWNMNITNTYALEEIGKIPGTDTVILSPELNLDRIKEIGETGIKKGLMIYGRLKGMFVEIPLFKDGETILKNDQGDEFEVIINSNGNSELYLKSPMNLIPKLDEISDAGIDELVLSFTNESAEETENILNSLKTKTGEYNPYNFQRGVY